MHDAHAPTCGVEVVMHLEQQSESGGVDEAKAVADEREHAAVVAEPLVESVPKGRRAGVVELAVQRDDHLVAVPLEARLQEVCPFHRGKSPPSGGRVRTGLVSRPPSGADPPSVGSRAATGATWAASGTRGALMFGRAARVMVAVLAASAVLGTLA